MKIKHELVFSHEYLLSALVTWANVADMVNVPADARLAVWHGQGEYEGNCMASLDWTEET